MKQIVLFLLLLTPIATANAQDWKDNVPDNLKGWIPWVLKSDDLDSCTSISSTAQNAVCNWYPRATLLISGDKAKFTQEVLLERKGRITLPNAEHSWPLNVRAGQRPVPVLNRSGTPSIWLDKGSYQITGELDLAYQPSFISFPATTGVIKVQTDAPNVSPPEIDNAGRIWLRKPVRTVDEKPAEQDFATFQFFRKISDNLPAELETLIRINVGGRSRELALPDVLLGTKAYEIRSNLPARLDQNNRLFLRATAGTWELRVKSIIAAPFSELTLVELGAELPDEEIWSFEAAPSLRSVRISGADGIDPQRSNLPSEWMHLPAYRLKAGQTLSALDEKRSDIKSQENQLSIKRDLKLHSNGLAYSVSDRIDGTIFVDGRLSVLDEVDLGSVSINNMDQAITKLAEGPAGVEIRTGPLNLNAESRLPRDGSLLSITGWQTNFVNPAINLYLPLGWRLLHVSGADTVSGSWISKWNLLDIFLVLTASILAIKVFGLAYGSATTLALVLLEQDFSLAGVFIFLVLLTALIRVVTQSFWAGLLKSTKIIVSLSLAFTFLSFGLGRVQTAIYPQLERQASFTAPTFRSDMEFGAMKEIAEAPAEMSISDLRSGSAFPARTAEKSRVQTFQNYQIDSLNLTQTGYGKVELRGAAYRLSWSGPVTPDEKIRVCYLTPFWNLVLAFVQVLLGALAIFLVTVRRFDFKRLRQSIASPLATCLALTLICPAIVRAQAEPFPSPEILQELRSYAVKSITEKPDCHPICATIGNTTISASERTLKIVMQIQAEAETALPVLTNLNNLELLSVTSSKLQTLAATKEGGILLLRVGPTTEAVTIEATLRGSTASFSFVEPPAMVSFVSSSWRASGIERGHARDLSLERIQKQPTDLKDSTGADDAQTESGISAQLLPLLRVERLVDFSANWTVNTSVMLAAPSGSVQTFELPLITGEAVTSPGYDVKNARIRFSFQPGQQRLTWNSILEVQEQIVLTANHASNFSETWSINMSNLWHAKYSGVPRIQTTENLSSNISQWRPRPGEELQINVFRPQGIVGPTKTINSATASYTVGSKIVEAVLRLNIKSSIGQSHSFKLPPSARIKQVIINGQTITSYSFINQQIEFDLTPGEQQVQVSWSEPTQDSILYNPTPIDLEAPAVNINTEISLQNNRWILWTKGPTQGPAVLFWGILPLIIIAAVVIGKAGLTPLNVGSALLLMLGLSMQPLTNVMVVIGLLLALGFRGRRELNKERHLRSNLIQLALGFWSLMAISNLLSAINNGLLGTPYMRIAGNTSTRHLLKWYQDVSEGLLPQTQVFSLPIFYYRVFMLLWALWLAFAVIRWGVWCWQQFSHGGAWVPPKPKVDAAKSKEPNENKSNEETKS